jgi:outer membrane protein assembly factor BamB
MAVFSVQIMKIFKTPTDPIAYGDFPALPVWVFSANDEIISTPGVFDHTIFVQTNNFLYSIDISKQIINWKVAAVNNQELVVPPLVANPLVIVAENGSSLSSYSIENGELVWKTQNIEIANNVTASIEAMTFNKRFLYVARFDWGLTAYNRETGELVWEHSIPGRAYPYIVANEETIILAVKNSISVLDAITGAILWEVDIKGYAGPILLSENKLFVTDEKNITITAIDLSTHQIDWVADYSSIIGSFDFSCLIEDGQNLVIASSKLVTVSKNNGKMIWKSEDMGTLECPIILKNNVYVRNTGNDLYSIDTKSGNVKGTLSVGEDTFLSHAHFRGPVALMDWLIVPIGDNRVSIYQP